MCHFRTIPSRGGKGYCSPGGRLWFKAKGWDWGDFVKRGLPEETFLATGDGLAIALVKWAREYEARCNG